MKKLFTNKKNIILVIIIFINILITMTLLIKNIQINKELNRYKTKFSINTEEVEL